MSAPTNTVVAAGGACGRPARAADPERGQHPTETVLSLTTGTGPEESKEDSVPPQPRPALSEAEITRRAARPVRDPDPKRNAAYWARIDAIVDEAPPLTNEQKAIIRTAFHGARAQGAA